MICDISNSSLDLTLRRRSTWVASSSSWSSLSTSLMSISRLTRLRSRSSISSMLEEKEGSSSELRLSWLLSLGVMEPFFMLLMLLFSCTLGFSGTFLSWKTSRMLCLELALSGVSTLFTLAWLPDPLVTEDDDVFLVFTAELELLVVLAVFPLLVIISVLVVFSVLEVETRDSVLVTE